LLWAGCSGGQTGEETAIGGRCFEREEPVDLPDSEALGAGFSGTYRSPLFWVDDDRVGDYVDPSEVMSTELTVEVKRRAGPARGYQACGASAWVPVDIEVRSEDRRLGGKRAAWLQLADRDQSGAAALRAGPNDPGVGLGGGYTLQLSMQAGELRGHVVGKSQIGYLRTTCEGDGFESQLPISERPADDARFAGVPPPAELLDALDGHAFEVDWGEGHRAELFAQVRSRSQHACWGVGAYGAGVRMGGEVELADARGVRVAAARVMIGVRPCERVVTSCLEFFVSGGGTVHELGEREPIPDLGFDDGGAWVSDWALGIVNLGALTGGAATSFDEGWQWGSYEIEMPLSDGAVGAPTLEIMLDRDEESTLTGSSAP
jgi:hypothetical protein